MFNAKSQEIFTEVTWKQTKELICNNLYQIFIMILFNGHYFFPNCFSCHFVGVQVWLDALSHIMFSHSIDTLNFYHSLATLSIATRDYPCLYAIVQIRSMKSGGRKQKLKRQKSGGIHITKRLQPSKWTTNPLENPLVVAICVTFRYLNRRAVLKNFSALFSSLLLQLLFTVFRTQWFIVMSDAFTSVKRLSADIFSKVSTYSVGVPSSSSIFSTRLLVQPTISIFSQIW